MNSLNGKRILVVEDEAIIAMTLEDILTDLGVRVIGPVGTVDDAMRLAETGEYDAAMLDLNLNGKRSDAVAEVLFRRAVPVVFASGYGSGGAQAPNDFEVLQKPYRADQVASALLKAMAASGPQCHSVTIQRGREAR